MSSAVESDYETETEALRAMFVWPKTQDVPYEILAEKIAEFCIELNHRELEMREHQLATALKVWPFLREALKARGKIIGINGYAEPVLPAWSDQPVVAMESYYGRKPKTKAEALAIVEKYAGEAGWCTIGEIWLYLENAGPIMERGLAKHGYLKPRSR